MQWSSIDIVPREILLPILFRLFISQVFFPQSTGGDDATTGAGKLANWQTGKPANLASLVGFIVKERRRDVDIEELDIFDKRKIIKEFRKLCFVNIYGQ